jgi:hypothetical protein
MARGRKLLIIGAASVALGAGGAGIPQAVGGPADEQVAGSQAERAKRAALEVVGAGQVVGVERGEEGAWRVEVFKPRERLGPWWDETVSGHHVEVRLNRDLEWVRAGTNEDGAPDEAQGDD